MPDITLTDNSSLSVAASLFDNSVIGKTPGTVARFLQADVLAAKDQPLDQVQISSTSLGLNFKPSFSLDAGNLALKAGGSLSAQIDLIRPLAAGQPAVLFDADRFGAAIDTGASCYLALTLQMAENVVAKAAPGAFALELGESATLSGRQYQPFPAKAGSFPSLQQALVVLLGSYHPPTSLDDVDAFAVGAGFVVEAKGSVHFNGQIDVLAAVNPTATPGVCQSFGPLSINAGPSVTIGGNFSLSGDFQVRIWKKTSTVVQLGYYRKRGGSLTLSFDASAGINATVGKFDVIAKLYSLLGDCGKLDPAWLHANVPAEIADQVEEAYEAAVQTSLSIALDAELDSSATDQAAFVWNFDTANATAEARAAFASALQGNLTALNAAQLPPGVRRAGSVLDQLKEKKHALTLNFLGLLDHASVEEFISRSHAKVSEDGQIILTDTEHLTRLEATATPLVKTDLLRHVYAEDCVATVGYAASLGSLTPQLEVAFSYYDYRDRMSITDLQFFFQIAEQVGIAHPASAWEDPLQGPVSNKPGSFFASLLYDASTAQRLFLDNQSTSRSEPAFQLIARKAAAGTPGLIADQRLRELLLDEPTWPKLIAAGSAPNFYQAIGDHPTSPSPAAIVLHTIFQHIVDWSSAMHAAAQALQDILHYLQSHPALDLLKDADFQSRRKSFATALQQAIEKTPLFHNAEGLITMYVAAKPTTRKVAIRWGATLREYV